jgi:hypothetical protein
MLDLTQGQNMQMDQLGDKIAGEENMADRGVGVSEGWCTGKRDRVAAASDGKWRPTLHPYTQAV